MELRIEKMITTYGEVVSYKLHNGEKEAIDMNALIGGPLAMRFIGKSQCMCCDKFVKKLFAQGCCYDCFINSPEASPCIISPELCEGHLGKGRDVEWEKAHHVQPHTVYLAVASALKVGVTRDSQIPTRWIDQGASFAIRLAETPYRKIAGDIEVALKGTLSDKTNWQAMLKNEIADVDLVEEKWKAGELLPMDLAEYMSENDEIVSINYPVREFPTKVTSVGFDKQPQISGTLMGIKGQYLIFDGGRVLNIRKWEGYCIELS
jgi:hypothetical protein